MSYGRIVISSGHGKYVRGASGLLDEVEEARNVVNRLADRLRDRGVNVKIFHDDTSRSQDENLKTIVEAHNAQQRDLDVSVHFNAYVETAKPMGTEVLYITQNALAGQVAAAIASCGFTNRGPKKRTDLYFLNNTTMPAILIETCFVDSAADAELYNEEFDAICRAEAQAPEASLCGKVSWFGGPNDKGVSPDEGLAFIDEVEDAPHLFLHRQPPQTTGLARRLDPHAHYIACRWDYDKTPKPTLLEGVALVRAIKTDRSLTAYPADWGPHEGTGRVADISPGLMEALGIQTDDEVEVIFPYEKLSIR
jgi:N-acetylmuramoyl-L-alanine amidase